MTDTTARRSAAAAVARDMRRNPIRYYRPNTTAAEFHLDTHRGRFLFGGNRSGKTFAVCAEAVMAMTGMNSVHVSGADKWKALKKTEDGIHLRHWCVDIKRSAEGVLLPIYLKLIPTHMLDQSRGRNGYNSEKATLYLKNGSWVQFMSYNMDALRGESVSLHGVLLDEPPKELIYRRQWKRLWDTGGFMVGAMTPWEAVMPWPIGWLQRRVWRGEDGDHIKCWRVEVWENVAHVDRESLERDIAAMSPEEYKACVQGHFGRLQGLVYSEFRREVHAAYDKADAKGLVKLAQAGVGEVYGGLDHGLRDPTACLWLFVCRKPSESLELAERDVILFRDYRQPGRTVQQNIAAIKAISAGVPVQGYYADPHMWDRDPHGGLTIAGHYIRSGIPVFQGNNCKDVGWTAVHDLLAVPQEGKYPPWPRFRIVKGTCRDTIREMLDYCWRPENQRTGKGGDKDMDVNDHCMDALRYFAAGCPKVARRKPSMRRPASDRITGMPADMFYSLPGVASVR